MTGHVQVEAAPWSPAIVVAVASLLFGYTVHAVDAAGSVPRVHSNASSLYVIRTFRTNSPMFRALWDKASNELPDARLFVLFDNSTEPPRPNYIDEAFHEANKDRIVVVSKAACLEINTLFRSMKRNAESMLTLLWRALTTRLRLGRDGQPAVDVAQLVHTSAAHGVDYVWLFESGS